MQEVLKLFAENLLQAVGIVLAIMWTFWAVYVLVMGVYRAHLSGRLGTVALILGLPIVVVGIVLDVLVNIFIATFLFLDLPREFLMTSRMIRYRNTDTGWRAKLSQFICDNLLDIFDPSGNHC